MRHLTPTGRVLERETGFACDYFSPGLYLGGETRDPHVFPLLSDPAIRRTFFGCCAYGTFFANYKY